jgi:hypothetical protein
MVPGLGARWKNERKKFMDGVHLACESGAEKKRAARYLSIRGSPGD